jgi:hypothetical protein
MEIRPAARATTRSRQWMVWGGLIALELLLMGAAFVGGQMLARQNTRNSRSPGLVQLPAQLPKDPVAGTGSVQKVQDTVITLTRGRGGAPGGPGPGASAASNQTDVAVTADTKYYKNTSSGSPGNPGAPGGQTQLQVQDATLADVKVGSTIMVWGPKNGERITAEVIYIQAAGR